MSARVLAALLALMMLPVGLAQDDVDDQEDTGESIDHEANHDDAVVFDGVLHDAVGDGPDTMDIRRIAWSLSGADVQVTLDSQPYSEAGITAILFVGTEGESEPDQAYILHHGPEGSRILHGQANGHQTTMTTSIDGSVVRFDLHDLGAAGCAFAVARVVTYQSGGQQVEDVVGWVDESIENAWNGGNTCSTLLDVNAPHTAQPDGVGTPGIGSVVLIVGLVGLAAMRRTQR